MRIDSESDDWLIAWDLYWNSLLFRAGGRGFGFGSLREEERLGEPMTEPEPVDESGSREPMKWLYSYGGHVRTAAERALGERLHPAKDLRKPGSRREWQREPKKHGRGGSPEETEEGWVTPRCSRTSMQGLRVLSNSAVLREDVSQRMTAVVQGKDPLIDDITLNSITMSADELAALDTTEQADCLDDLGRQEMSVRVEDSVVSWPEPEAKVQHRVSGYEYPDCRPSGRNAASLRETYSEHPESIGSQALRGGRSSQLKYIVTSQQIEQQKKLQRDLEHKVDIAHAHLNQSIQSTEEVDGVKSQNWDKMCASKARDLDQHVRLQRQRQAVIRDNTTVESEVDKLTAARTEEDRARAAHELSCICLGDKIQAKRNRQAVAEGGRVVGVLLQLISPRYAASTQREAIWTLTLIADEPQARRTIRASRCFPRLLRLLNSKSESVVEAICQLLARLAYDPECAEMMLAAGGIPMLRQLTLYPNINVRDLCKDAIEALDFAENPH